MGTRGTIHFIDEKKTIASIYRQMDSYPSGLGEELYQMLKFSKIVNGYSTNMQCPNEFNGMGCLAAYVIGCLKLFPYGQHKNAIGNVYMTNAKDRQEYNYFISADKDNNLILKVTNSDDKQIFKGAFASFNGKKLEGKE